MYLGDASAYESVTVAAAAVGGTSATYTLADTRKPFGVLVTVETGDIRYRVDGGDPTATEGHLAAVGQAFTVEGYENVTLLKMIRTSATSATVRLTYFYR